MDQALAKALPGARALLEKRVELIAIEVEPAEPVRAPSEKLTVDELIAARLVAPPGVGPISVEDMERAIEKGATGGVD